MSGQPPPASAGLSGGSKATGSWRSAFGEERLDRIQIHVRGRVTQNRIASQRERSVARAILGELRSAAMSRPSIELDDDALDSPQDIYFDRHLVQLDRCVPFGRWQVFIQDQGPEAV